MENNKNPLKIQEIKINNQYSFKSNDRLGSGSFGQIFKGMNIKTREEVAIKIESTNIETPQLLHEYKILKNFQNIKGFPQIYLYTPLDDTLVMIMELLGDNLEKIMQLQKNKKFSYKTVLMIAIQILERIQHFHENNYIIIQDQLWNVLKIPPQTSISFSTKNKQIRYIDNNRRCSYYSISEKFPTELEEYKTTYNDTLKNDILGTLPSMLRDNSKLQKISTNYTKLLWTIFPFRYHKNVNILNEYIPYFNLDWKKEYESVNNWYSILRENEKIWLKNINWWDKYKFF